MGDVDNSLLAQKTPEENDKNKMEKEFVHADGGVRAWLVMLGSFFCNGIVFGVINSYSVLYTEIRETLQYNNDTEASSKAALVGSLTISTTFVMSPVAGILTDLMGIRTITLLGGLLASGGLLLSSFVSHSVQALCFTYGIMFGFGSALAYTPSLVILGHYFHKYLGLVNGVVTSGSSVFTIILPYVISSCLNEVGLNWTLRVLTVCASGVVLSAALFKPAIQKEKIKKPSIKTAFNIKVLQNKRYLLWAIFVGISLFGYFVPYVHMIKFVQDNFEKDVDAKLPVMCIGISSGLGRLFFGYIADNPKVSRIMLQQISFLVLGIITIMLPFTKGMFTVLLFSTFFMGIFDGCFVTMIGPIAFDICGEKGATQAIGFILGLCSIPLTVGPYVAGKLYDHIGNYDLAFRLAGIPPITGALLMISLRYIRNSGDSLHPEKQNNKQAFIEGNGMKELRPLHKEEPTGRT